ncbi:hypothetical protein NC653_009420 [Populus alba x Populus x berolinensis]|uniref:Uncharacterized protein n=1 Tax=Populus alba x Populus x berolinensis TaxID=444605 RepID=A0AAD6RA58_9ROSI|nr:hypothetical protein NC653_009420 [Populus alba x Populus x berolinensis]
MYSRCLFLPGTRFALETPRKAAAVARLSYLQFQRAFNARESRGCELFPCRLLYHVPERLISSFTKPKTLISSSGERLALSVLIWNLITQSPRLPFCQLPLGYLLMQQCSCRG